MKAETGWVRLNLMLQIVRSLNPFSLSAKLLRSIKLPLLIILMLACSGIALANFSFVVTAPNGTDTDPLNLTPEVQAAFEHFYNLDYAGAEVLFKKIAAQHPTDPMAADYLLDNAVIAELYRLDLLDTTLYVKDGFLTGKHPVVEDMNIRAKIDALYARAVDLSNQRLHEDPHDLNALFARGFAVSLETMYMGMVEKHYIQALHLALAARKDDDAVLARDPKYIDCYLVVGVHDYVVGSLAFPFKIVAGIVGFHGSKSKGLADLRRVGQYGILNSVSARTSLELFLRREAKYSEAIQVVNGLHSQYPHNFLFALEQANLLKDSGQGMAAMAAYRSALETATRPGGYYPNAHLEMAYYGLGEAARGQRQIAVAAAAYKDAADQSTASLLMKRRAHLAAGKMFDRMGQHSLAQQQYADVVALGADSGQAQEAKHYEQSPYTGE